jgi:hypothetical protein
MISLKPIIVKLALMKLVENSSRMSEIECRLSKYTYLTRNNLPGYPDGVVFRFLSSASGTPSLHTAFPDRATHPNFYHWYILMRQFNPATISKWISTRLYLDPEDTLPSKFTSQETPSNPIKSCRLPPQD